MSKISWLSIQFVLLIFPYLTYVEKMPNNQSSYLKYVRLLNKSVYREPTNQLFIKLKAIERRWLQIQDLSILASSL